MLLTNSCSDHTGDQACSTYGVVATFNCLTVLAEAALMMTSVQESSFSFEIVIKYSM